MPFLDDATLDAIVSDLAAAHEAASAPPPPPPPPINGVYAGLVRPRSAPNPLLDKVVRDFGWSVLGALRFIGRAAREGKKREAEATPPAPQSVRFDVRVIGDTGRGS